MPLLLWLLLPPLLPLLPPLLLLLPPLLLLLLLLLMLLPLPVFSAFEPQKRSKRQCFQPQTKTISRSHRRLALFDSLLFWLALFGSHL